MRTKKKTIQLSDTQRDVFLEALMNPKTTGKKMRGAFAYYYEKRKEVRTFGKSLPT